MDGGLMDGWDGIAGCRQTDSPPYQCYSQYQPDQIPNLSALASRFAVPPREVVTAE